MQSEILELILAGKNESHELKTSVRDPRILAKLIGSVANTQGGKIVIGVKKPPEVVGVDEGFTRRANETARKPITPESSTKLIFIESEGKSVAVIDVERSSEIVLSEGSAFIMAGTITQPITWTQMRKQLQSHPSVSMVESLTRAIERQSKLIEEMHEQIGASNTWQTRWKERGIGFLLGIFASVTTSIVDGRTTSWRLTSLLSLGGLTI